MRSIGLDIHRDFMEVAIAEGGEIRGGPRVAMDSGSLELFAESLGRADEVALEVSGNAWEAVRILRPHVARLVAASPADTGMRQARAKTDRLDARALARLLASGQLQTVWVPDEATEAMRRRLRRRSQLTTAKSRAKNEIHAALMRRLIPKPGFSDLFGKAGRRWLEELELPAAERESVDSALRQIAFCEAEIAAIEKTVASEALASEQIRRLMSVPGVGVITAAAFMAAVGDIGRFPSPKKLVGYLGLDPIVRQSGSSEANYGRISKQGSAAGRYALVEASWSVVKAPGPLRAFYERTKARRGASVAIVATARKLACLCWALLTRGEDYAYGQPSLRQRKLRQLELRAGAPKHSRSGRGVWKANAEVRNAERKMAEQAETAYRRNVAEFKRVEALRAKQRKEAEKVTAEQQR
jgi:transposase